jgi:hypothetical protein
VRRDSSGMPPCLWTPFHVPRSVHFVIIHLWVYCMYSTHIGSHLHGRKWRTAIVSRRYLIFRGIASELLGYFTFIKRWSDWP